MPAKPSAEILKNFDLRLQDSNRTGQRRAAQTMATLQSIPRLLVPRASFLLRPQPRSIIPLPTATIFRYASSSSNPKTLSEQFRKRQQQQKATPVIPQPDKYRPPSHGARTPRSQTEYRSYGPALTEEDKLRMRTKKYPNMMSPEGTFSHWFFNNRIIHLWISMVRNVSKLPRCGSNAALGHSRLPCYRRLVYGLHGEDYLRRTCSLAQRVLPSPVAVYEPLYRRLQDAYSTPDAARAREAIEERGGDREKEAVSIGEGTGGRGEG